VDNAEENTNASQNGQTAPVRSNVSDQEGSSEAEGSRQEADASQGGEGVSSGEKPQVTPADGVWRPELWKNDRYLIVRYLPGPMGQLRERQVYSDSRFGATANIYESLDSAQSTADRLNAEIMDAISQRGDNA